MELNIYGLKRTPMGKFPDKAFLARVELVSMGLKIECYDDLLKEKLRDIFSNPLIIRTPIEEEFKTFSHKEEAIQPFTEDFFREIIFILHKWDLHGVIQEEKRK